MTTLGWIVIGVLMMIIVLIIVFLVIIVTCLMSVTGGLLNAFSRGAFTPTKRNPLPMPTPPAGPMPP